MARMVVRSSFLTPLTQVTDRIGHPLPEAVTDVEIAGSHLLVGNTMGTESRQLNSPGWVRSDGCTASTAASPKSS